MQHRYNLSKLEKPNLVETDEGFLQIKGNILKADSFMEYRNKRGVLREKIPKEILFSEETKKSFLNKKITLEHPMENGKLAMVDSKNVNQFGKGNVIEVFENGDYLGATLQVEDPDTIQFIKERYKNNEESRNKTIYRRGKSATFKFLEIASIEHLKEIENIVKKRLEEIE